METIKRFLANPIVSGVLGLLVGIFIGLIILGWWLIPVKWTDAAPADLRSDAQVAYLRACIDAYGYNGDAARAKDCYDSLGAGAGSALKEIVDNPATQNSQMIAAFGSIALNQGPPPAEGTPQVGAAPTAVEQPAPGSTVFPLTNEQSGQNTAKGGLPSWFTFLCVGILILLAIVAGVMLLNRFGFLKLGGTTKTPKEESKDQTEPAEYTNLDEPPISQNVSSYSLGDDLFDDVFSIEADGQFLGEYGVAIADATGVGGPKKVSAFEVWLFDKNHIPTTTKVLMSEQSYNDASRREKLKTKGEPVLADPNQPVVLETNNLRLIARIVRQEYSEGAAGSYFQSFVLDLKVWPR